MSKPAINCSPEIIAGLEQKIVSLQSKLEQAELSEANLSVWKRSAEISIEAQADTISRLTADNEALRSALEAERAAMDVTQRRAISAESRADALAQEVERLKAEKENLQGVLQAAHDALKRDIPAKAFHAVRAAIRALANEEAGG